MCLEGFADLLHLVIARQRDTQEFGAGSSGKGESLDLATFLSHVGPSPGEASQPLASERIMYFIRLLQVCVCMRACVCVCEKRLRAAIVQDRL